MKHITKYNLAYLVFVLIIFGGSLIAGAYYRKAAIPVLSLVLLFLFPSAIQGFFWHEFFLGRRLIRLGQLSEAKEHFEKFLEQTRVHTWLKRLIHLRWAAYTGDIEAMAWSNLGVIHINMADVDRAESAFEKASRIDPDYPIPHFNLSLIALIRGKDAQARDLWKKANDLGYRKGDFGQMIKLANDVKNKLHASKKE